MPLYEIFIRMYLEMLLMLIKRGLKSTYTRREDNLNFWKGKLLFNQQIRYNTVHREKFFVSFDEYNLDRPEHRLIKSAFMKLRQKSQNVTNRQLIYRMLAEFDFVALCWEVIHADNVEVKIFFVNLLDIVETVKRLKILLDN